MAPKIVNEIEWSDLPFRIANCLVRKASGYFSKLGSEDFDGFNERSLVAALGALLENSGFDVYYDCQYPQGNKKNYCDIFAESWVNDRNAYIETKLIWDTKDKRLNINRFLSPGEILNDLYRLREFSPSDAARLIVVAAHSPSKNLEQAIKNKKTYRLGDAVKVLSDKSRIQPFWCYTDLMKYTEIAFERLRYLHILCWLL